MSSARFLRLAATVTAVAVTAAACGDLQDSETAGQGFLGDASSDARLVEGGLGSDAMSVPDAGRLNPLCGAGYCGEGLAPEDPTACEGYDAGLGVAPPDALGPGSGGATGGRGGAAGAPSGGGGGGIPAAGGQQNGSGAGGLLSIDASATDVSDADTDATAVDAPDDVSVAMPDARLEAGSPSEVEVDALSADATGGTSGGERDVVAPLPPESPEFACQVVVESAAVVHRCDIAGHGMTGAACTSSRDCAPGLGCVGAENPGQCLPFCCRDPEACAEDSYCDVRPLRFVNAPAEPPLVPVCVRADPCRLDCDPSAGEECSCPAGKTCSVVRNGTTACVDPGSGTTGRSCPCAPGYFCSFADTCIKFCRTAANGAECGDGRCQATATFPAGYGLCVGLAAPNE